MEGGRGTRRLTLEFLVVYILFLQVERICAAEGRDTETGKEQRWKVREVRTARSEVC